jgi:hypothetical protein
MDKNTHQIKICDCSPQFLERGEEKVIKAVEAFVLHHKTENFDPTQYFTNETLT